MPRPFGRASPTAAIAAVGDLDVAADEPRRRRARLRRRASSLERRLHVAACRSSRVRACVRVDAGEQRDDRDLRAAVRLGERARRPRPRETPVASRRPCARARASFSFAARTSTIRSPYVLPSRIIATVEIVFRTSFCAVPALSRVEPATNSGPTTTASSWSADARELRSRSATRRDASARLAARRASSAPSTKGVRPLALTPTTASAAETPSSSTARRPAAASSSAASRSADEAPAPATSATTCPGARREGRLALRRRRARAMPAGRAGADVDQPAAAPRAARRPRRSPLRRPAPPRADGGRNGRVLVVHQLDELARSSAGRSPASARRASVTSRRGSAFAQRHRRQSKRAGAQVVNTIYRLDAHVVLLFRRLVLFFIGRDGRDRSSST